MKTRNLKIYWSAITKITFSISLLLLLKFQVISQQILVNDDFSNYTLGNICSNSNWTGTSSPPIINIENTTPITFQGYNSSGGNYIKYDKESTDYNSLVRRKIITETAKEGDIFYFSFLFKLKGKPGYNSHHFISLGNSYDNIKFNFLRIFARGINKGIELGITKGRKIVNNTPNEEITWGTKELNLNETYLILVKYIFKKDKDEIYLWVNPNVNEEPNKDDSYVQKSDGEDKLYPDDNIDGIDLTYLSITSPAPIIDGIKLVRGNISKTEESWNTFKNIAYNTPPQIKDQIEDISVLENSENTTICLRNYFLDSEDEPNDLTYSITTGDTQYYSTSIDNSTGNLIIDYSEKGTIRDSKITIRATDSGGMSIDQSFLITINASQISFNVTGNENINETDTAIKTFSIIKTGITNINSQINFTIKGTALNNIDYKIIDIPADSHENSGTINFKPNENIKTISLKIIDDKYVEENKTITLILNNPPEISNTQIITPTATKIINDNDFAPIIKPEQSYTITGKCKTNTLLGTLEISDQMSETTLQNWTIVKNINIDGDINNAFDINTITGEITINDAGDLNYEINNKLTIQVKVSDGYNVSNPENITININKTDEETPSDIIYVTTTGNDKNSGYSWNDALNTIQAAINQADKTTASEIWVAKGTYLPTYLYNGKYAATTNNEDLRKKSFIIRNNIKLYGGFSGIEKDVSQRKKEDINNDGYISPWEIINETILCGNIGCPDDSRDNCYHVLFCNNIYDKSSEINGFVIKGGYANGTGLNENSGGGIYCGEYCNIKISNNIIKDNSASQNGGGIFCQNSKTNINTNHISHNSALNGAGIYCYKECNAFIIKNHIIKNNAKEYGGGLYCTEESTPFIINNIIYNNSASKSGGGIVCNQTSNAHITNNTIVNNSANLFGGGIFCINESTPFITNTILWGNKEDSKPNQYNSSGAKDPYISHSAIQGGFKGDNIIDLSPENNSINGPCFYNTEENKEDWRIRLYSICKDKASTDTTKLFLPKTDISGYKRIHGTTDIGAYEIPIDNLPKAVKSITYGQMNSEAGINISNTQTSVPGHFSYKNPKKEPHAGEEQTDTIIFTPLNRKDLYNIEETIKINVNKALITITADNKSKKYKEENPILSFRYEGFKYNEDYSVIDTLPIIVTTGDINSRTGNYPITFKEGSDNNYEFKYISGNLEIIKQNPTISKWPDILKEITYGQKISESVINNSNFASSVKGTFSFKEPDKILNAGPNQNINITFTPDDNNNYNSVEKRYTINVKKALLTITADNKSKKYKEENPTLSYKYEGFKNDEDYNVIDTLPIIETTGDINSPTGNYLIIFKKGADNNYDFKYIIGNLEIIKQTPNISKWPDILKEIIYGQKISESVINNSNFASSVKGTFSFKEPDKILNAGPAQNIDFRFTPEDNNNYNTVEKTISINVNKAILKVTADNKTKKYKEENPDFSFEYEGFINNENTEVIDRVPILETLADINSPTGNYPITFKEGSDNNYEFKYISGNLEIIKQNPIISKWPDISRDITYGQTLSEYDINNSFSTTSVKGTFTFKEPFNISNAGLNQNIVLVFTPDDKNNYSSLEKTYNINVHKAILTLSVDNQTIHYGDNKPQFNIKYSGFQNNENESIFNNHPVAEIYGNWPLAIGQYDIFIDLTNITAQNYKLISHNGKLTILNNPPALVSKIPNIAVLENAENKYIDLTNYFTDIEQVSSELTYTVESDIPDHLDCSIRPDNQLIIDFEETGTQKPEIIVIRATDKYNEYAEQSFTIEVSPGKADFSVYGNESFEEGNIGTCRKSFTVNKHGLTNQICSVEYEIKGNANLGSDYLITGRSSTENNLKGKLIFKAKRTF